MLVTVQLNRIERSGFGCPVFSMPFGLNTAIPTGRSNTYPIRPAPSGIGALAGGDMKVNVLGTEYTVTTKKYDEDEAFERLKIVGYCDGLTKQIVLCDMNTCKGWEHEPPETIEASRKETLRFSTKAGLPAVPLKLKAHGPRMRKWWTGLPFKVRRSTPPGKRRGHSKPEYPAKPP